MASAVVPRRWCSQRIRKDDNRLQIKKTEIFAERIFTAILQIENREEKLE